MAATNLPTSGRLPSSTTKFGVGRAMAPTVAALSVAACVPTLAIGLRSTRASDRNPSLDRRALNTRFRSGLIAISPKLFASLMGAHAQAIAEWESPRLRLPSCSQGLPRLIHQAGSQ